MKTIYLKVKVPDEVMIQAVITWRLYGLGIKHESIDFTEIQLPTDDEIESYALENVLDIDSLEGFEDVRKFINGAEYVLNKLKG